MQSYAIQSIIPIIIFLLNTRNTYSDAESKDRALQQRVRRLHFKLEKGVVNPDNPVGTEKDYEDHIALGKRACVFLTKSTDPFLATKSCSDALSEAGFVKLSKREPFAGKLSPGELNYLGSRLPNIFLQSRFDPFCDVSHLFSSQLTNILI